MVVFDNIYQNKNVLVTGHTGFKGSWLSLWLSEMGANVLGYALKPDTTPNHFSLINVDIESNIYDIRNKEKLNDIFTRFQPEIVFHLAAQSLVRRSYNNPSITYETNVMGTVNVLEACRMTDSVKAIIIITSDKCYKNREWVWGYRENDPLGGYDPYSASKACAEIVTNSYLNSFFNIKKYGITHNAIVASVRAGNVIGGGDWAENRLIPDIMKAVVKNEEVIIKNPRAIRPWQHVLEPLGGYLLLGQKLLEGKKDFTGAWNFAPGDDGTISVLEIVKNIKKIWNKIKYKTETNFSDLHEANMLKLDSSKAHIKLNWKNVWNSGTTLIKTAEWYRAFYEQNKVLTHEHLWEYLKDASTIGLF